MDSWFHCFTGETACEKPPSRQAAPSVYNLPDFRGCLESYRVGPQFGIAQLVHITPISLWFMVYITIVFMGVIQQLIARGPHLVGIPHDSSSISGIFHELIQLLEVPHDGNLHVDYIELPLDHDHNATTVSCLTSWEIQDISVMPFIPLIIL